MEADLIVYGGLFAAAFAAATLLPAQSEALLAGLLCAGYSPIALIAVASIGNVGGSVLNWWLGAQINRFQHRRWFPVREQQLERATKWYRRYGRWSLLLSWVPVIGDPLTLAAGVLREPLATFIVLVSLAKVTRYVVIAMVVWC